MDAIKKQIQTWAKTLTGLNNDAEYWDLCRTYGDYSREVYNHLRYCAAVQAHRTAE